MLAQNFQTAKTLRITEDQYQALIKTLTLLETDKLIHVQRDYHDVWIDVDASDKFTGHFNMDAWLARSSCGTVACIGGTAELVGHVKFASDPAMMPPNLYKLFYPAYDTDLAEGYYESITAREAAQALRNYLTIGEPRWRDVLIAQ